MLDKSLDTSLAMSCTVAVQKMDPLSNIQVKSEYIMSSKYHNHQVAIRSTIHIFYFAYIAPLHIFFFEDGKL